MLHSFLTPIIDKFSEANITSNEELHSSSGFDLFFKRIAFCHQIWSVAVKDVCVSGVNIYVLEEISPHEGMVTFWVISLQGCKTEIN